MPIAEAEPAAAVTTVRCIAVRWVSDDQPGWVEVELTDAAGTAWSLLDKQPMFGDPALTSDADYPRTLLVECDVLNPPQQGLVDIVLRHGVKCVTGTSRFRVSAADIHVG